MPLGHREVWAGHEGTSLPAIDPFHGISRGRLIRRSHSEVDARHGFLEVELTVGPAPVEDAEGGVRRRRYLGNEDALPQSVDRTARQVDALTGLGHLAKSEDNQRDELDFIVVISPSVVQERDPRSELWAYPDSFELLDALGFDETETAQKKSRTSGNSSHSAGESS